jgi:Protein of unknown function (DUF3352)
MTTCCSSGTILARRSLISVCVASLLGAATLFSGGGDGAPPPIDPALLFPSGTVMTLAFDGGPCAAHSKELAISKIWQEAEVQEFLKDTLVLVKEQVDGGVAPFLKQLGIEDADLNALAKGRIAIGVTRFEMAEAGPAVDLMLAAELRGGQKAADSLLKALEAQMGAGGEGPIKETTLAGIPAKTMSVPDGGPFSGVTYLFHEGWLIAGTSTTQLEAALGRAKSGDQKGSLLADAAYAAGMKEVARPKTIASFFLDLGVVVGSVSEMPGMSEILASSGMNDIKSIFYGMDLDGPAIRDRMYAGIKPGSPMSKLQVPMDTAGVLSRIPKRSILAYSASLDFKGYFDYMVEMFKANPEVGDEVDSVLAEVDQALGKGWRQDLLPNLGPEVAGFVAMPRFGFLPEIGVLVKVKDRAKVESAIAKMFDSEGRRVVASTKFLDTTINTVDLGKLEIDPDFNLRPAYAFTGDYLMISPSPHTAKSLLVAMANKDGGLAANESFVRAFGALRADNPNAGNLGVSYIDLPWLAGFLLDSGIPLIQSAVPPDELAKLERENIKLDLAKIPSTDSVVKHLGPIIMATQAKEGGTYAEVVSPTGMIAPVMAIAAAATVVGMREARSMDDPGEDSERGARRRARAARGVPPPVESRPAKPQDKDEDR